MDIEQSPSGQIIKVSTGYKAFIPAALPPKLEWDDALVYSLSRADFSLGKLAREGSRLPESTSSIASIYNYRSCLIKQNRRHSGHFGVKFWQQIAASASNKIRMIYGKFKIISRH
jgi:hypothetical protein